MLQEGQHVFELELHQQSEAFSVLQICALESLFATQIQAGTFLVVNGPGTVRVPISLVMTCSTRETLSSAPTTRCLQSAQNTKSQLVQGECNHLCTGQRPVPIWSISRDSRDLDVTLAHAQ